MVLFVRSHLLRRVVLAVHLPPQFGVQLQLHILKIYLTRDFLHIALCDIVGGIVPVRVLGELGELLPVMEEGLWGTTNDNKHT